MVLQDKLLVNFEDEYHFYRKIKKRYFFYLLHVIFLLQMIGLVMKSLLPSVVTHVKKT